MTTEITSKFQTTQPVQPTAGNMKESFVGLSLAHIFDPSAETLAKMSAFVAADPNVTQSVSRFNGYVTNHTGDAGAQVSVKAKPTTGLGM